MAGHARRRAGGPRAPRRRRAGVSDTSARRRASSASSSRNAHCSSVTASSARSRLRRSLTSMRRRWSKVRDIGREQSTAGTRRVWQRTCRMAHDARTRSSRAEHDELRASVRRFVDTEVRPARRRVGGGRALPRRAVPPVRRARLPRPPLPRALGRQRRRPRRGHRVRRGARPLRRGARSRWRSRCRPTWPRPRSREFGTDDQRERWLAPAIAGEKIGAIAITEPDAGSDVAAIRTRAVRDGDVWRVNGRKMFITNGTRAALPHARRADRPRRRAPRHLAVHRRHRRCRASRCRASSRSSACGRSDTAEIALDDVAGPARRPHRRSNPARASRS